jgi:ferredoxin-NADP reductase
MPELPARVGRFPGRLLTAVTDRLTGRRTIDDYLGLIDPLLDARHPAGRVTEVRAETATATTLVIRPGRGWTGHRAGQFLPVGVELDGVRHWRTYSLTSPPGRPGRAGEPLTITVRAAPCGRVSPQLAHRTPPDSVLRLGPAQGEFTFPEPLPPRLRILLLTAGTGITPVMGLLRTLIRDEPHHPPDVVLLHSAPTAHDALFRAELQDWADRLPWLRFQPQYTRLTPARIEARCPDWRDRETWACGPAGLLAAVEEQWARAGRTEALHLERFSLAPMLPAVGEPAGGRVLFTRSRLETEADASVPLLVAGEAAGVVMPSGCRRGICHSCLVPLLRGRVRDLRTGELQSPEPGRPIQTCVNAAAGPVALQL